MEISNSAEKEQAGKFWQGFLLSLLVWILDIGVAAVLYSLAINSRHFRIYPLLLMPMGVVLGVVWLPVAFIAGSMSRKKGFKDSLSLILITSFLAPILVGWGFVMLVALIG